MYCRLISKVPVIICRIPISGTASDVGGIVSATSCRNTVNDSSIVTPGKHKTKHIKFYCCCCCYYCYYYYYYVRLTAFFPGHLNKARDDGVWGWQWHHHMQTICTEVHTDNHTNASSFMNDKMDNGNFSFGRYVNTIWRNPLISDNSIRPSLRRTTPLVIQSISLLRKIGPKATYQSQYTICNDCSQDSVYNIYIQRIRGSWRLCAMQIHALAHSLTHYREQRTHTNSHPYTLATDRRVGTFS